jgi:hypothetical protein
MTRPARALFVATILLGSLLLFLVQPMVARMALPRLGGAPNVWNSAMLVYQALLLGGYLYAHALGRLALRKQAFIHLGLLVAASLWLPFALPALPPPPPGSEVLWVPLLLLLTVGPVFLLVSAQAPLMQRWFAADPDAGEPWALYAASNLGSFAGLIAYPLLAEPLLTLQWQSLAWSFGYAALILAVASCAWSRRALAPTGSPRTSRPVSPPVPAQRFALWVVLAAIPSGLMLSTTTYLTTDVLATPLLWVIPLGLYLLSFVVAFSEWRAPAEVFRYLAPVVVLFFGSYAMVSEGVATLALAFGTCLLLFDVAVSLHGRMYDLRPEADRLTQFYLAMAIGGALGGAFTALAAPVLFDWVWEHPILVLAAALVMPLPEILRWRHGEGIEPATARIVLALLLALAALLGWKLYDAVTQADESIWPAVLTIFLTGIGILAMAWRWAYVAVLAILMIAQGGYWTFMASWEQERTRSYFGVYTVRDYLGGAYYDGPMRILTHGTTLHGNQSLDPARRRETMTYYGPTSGAGLALAAAAPDARVGLVGLGTGTLACYAKAAQDWTFFEIDPTVLQFSRPDKGRPRFTYLADCKPDAKVRIGDARLGLADAPPGSFDVLVIDAFSSDAIPLHLMTSEAVAVYLRALAPGGVIVVHISNRFMELEPQVAALAKEHGLSARKRFDFPKGSRNLTPSDWIALAREPATLDRLAQARPDEPWSGLMAPAPRVWTDDYASILPVIRWSLLMGNP